MRARQHLELLNRNKDVPAPEPGEDHKTYLIIYQQGIPTPANRKAVTLRKMMLMNQPKQIQAQDNMQNMQNISQAQAGNAIIQENNQNLASNEDVNV
jgi:hypothetical protein